MSLPTSMANFVPYDRLLRKAYCRKVIVQQYASKRLICKRMLTGANQFQNKSIRVLYISNAVLPLDALLTIYSVQKIVRPQLYGLGYYTPHNSPTPINFIEYYIYVNLAHVVRVKVDPAWSFIIKCANIPLSLSFPQSFDHCSGFCRVNFHFFDTNFFFRY